MSQPTITVSTWYGVDKQVTRDEFIKRWMEHTRELRNLSWNHSKEILEIEETVLKICHEEFDRILETQQGA